MVQHAAFDRARAGFIHLAAALSLAVLATGCDERAAAPDATAADAAAPVAPQEPEQPTAADAGGPEAAATEAATGIFTRAGTTEARAVGWAPLSADMGLARSRAAARARSALQRLLHEQGLGPAAGGPLAGARIDRVWQQGRRLYALAVMPIEKEPAGMNERGAAPSNDPESERPATAAPQGGKKP
jgi:hypothetical protein